MYLEYAKDEFASFEVSKYKDPELYEFVNRAKGTGLQFSKYSDEQLERFIEEIYELRKNQLNNPAR